MPSVRRDCTTKVTYVPRFRSLTYSPVYDCPMKRIINFLCAPSALLLAVLFLPACNPTQLLCGSARPAPTITSLSATTVTFAQVQEGYLLTVTGTNVLASSVVEVNGTAVTSQVISSTELQTTLTETQIPGPGTASITINTPSGNSGDLGCTSGGTSVALTLTIN
jgi:hypothetical protein